MCRNLSHFSILTAFLLVLPRSFAEEILQLGQQFEVGGKPVRIAKLEMLPYVQSEYTRRFKFDSAANQKLKELRATYQLDQVIAPGKDEFEKQVLLMDWVHHRFKKFGQPSVPTRGALDILRSVDQGHTFFCTQYAQLLASSAASLGWVDRVLALRRHQGSARGGSTEHSTTEIWSNHHRKWIMLDPTSNMYLEKSGTPLNAWEIRQEWFYNDGRDLVFVIGKERKKYRKTDLPIFLKRFDGFGDLTVEPDELDKYGFIGYIPNTDLMDSGFDYGAMFIVKDQLCAGTPWHTRTLPADPANDPYFPIGQATLALSATNEGLQIEIKTLTPNFKEYQTRFDNSDWRKSPAQLTWNLHAGTNRFEARTVNDFGTIGPVSVIELLCPE